MGVGLSVGRVVGAEEQDSDEVAPKLDVVVPAGQAQQDVEPQPYPLVQRAPRQVPGRQGKQVKVAGSGN